MLCCSESMVQQGFSNSLYWVSVLCQEAIARAVRSATGLLITAGSEALSSML